MSELESPRPQGAESDAGARPAKVPLTARLLLRESRTARRAAAMIAAFTLLTTAARGILARLIDRLEAPTIGNGLWFACRRSPPSGYADVTPNHTDGRFIAAS